MFDAWEVDSPVLDTTVMTRSPYLGRASGAEAGVQVGSIRRIAIAWALLRGSWMTVGSQLAALPGAAA